MSIAHIAHVWTIDVSSTLKLVALALAHHADDKGECFPSVARLAERCSLSERAIYSTLRELEAIGYLKKRTRPGRSTVYQVADPCTPFTPERRAPLNDVQDTPAPDSPPPLNVVQGTPERGAPIITKESPIEEKHRLPATPGAEAPTGLAVDDAKVIDPIWHTGLAFLERKGIPIKQARAFLGKLKREVGDIDAAALLAQAEADDVTDPIPWLSKAAVARRSDPRSGRVAIERPDANSAPPCPIEAIVDEYRRVLPMLPRIRMFPEASKEMLRARWREDSERQDLRWWTEFFEFVRDQNPFLVGDKTDFQADLLWLVDETNFAKVVNGKYQVRNEVVGSPASRRPLSPMQRSLVALGLAEAR